MKGREYKGHKKCSDWRNKVNYVITIKPGALLLPSSSPSHLRLKASHVRVWETRLDHLYSLCLSTEAKPVFCLWCLHSMSLPIISSTFLPVWHSTSQLELNEETSTAALNGFHLLGVTGDKDSVQSRYNSADTIAMSILLVGQINGFKWVERFLTTVTFCSQGSRYLSLICYGSVTLHLSSITCEVPHHHGPPPSLNSWMQLICAPITLFFYY